MQKKRRGLLVTIFLVSISLITAQAALAGQVFDIGDVPGIPPAGSVNWTAWLTKYLGTNTWPSQVMTEDGTNSELGTNWGYLELDPDTHFTVWVMQVINFKNPAPADGDRVEMILGGIFTPWTGYVWRQGFNWNQNDPSATYNGTATQVSTTHPCPILTPVVFTGSAYNLSWYGEDGLYKVYRSQNVSGTEPPNGMCNGYYYYIGQATASGGAGSYIDTTYDPAYPTWYIVAHADSSGALDGCHSEDIDPTAVTLASFTAEALPLVPSVALKWDTVIEAGLLGFNLYRSTDPYGLREILNNSLIPARYFGQLRGDQYIYEDLDVTFGQTYFYWIEAVKQQGSTEELGPQVVLLGSKIFLPVLCK